MMMIIIISSLHLAKFSQSLISVCVLVKTTIFLGDFYDIPIIFRVTSPCFCRERSSLHRKVAGQYPGRSHGGVEAQHLSILTWR